MSVQNRLWNELQPERLPAVRGAVGWLVAMAMLLMLAGLVALLSTVSTTILSMAFLGLILLFAGIVHVITGFMERDIKEVLPDVFVGILTGIAGVVVLLRPVGAAAAITLVFSMLFLVGGLVRVITAVMMRDMSWPWAVISGVITSLLGLMLLLEWPVGSLSVIGLFIAIMLVMAGVHVMAVAVQAGKIVNRRMSPPHQTPA